MKGDLICWDSSVLISWIRGDEGADRVQAMRAVVEGPSRVKRMGWLFLLYCT